MKRREFTKLAGLSIIAVSTTGFIRFKGGSFSGDCATTSDILGPFYRPDSPVRSNLVIPGEKGEIVELSGIIRHKDCSTLLKNAKVELWHCSNEELYDNDSEEYRYRGTTFTDEKGKYKFTTQLPVPYDAGGGNYRPAHFHLMISAPEYHSLITQIYFQGDPYLSTDPSSSSSAAEKRILMINKTGEVPTILFDCNMSSKLKASEDALKRITGKYKNSETGIITEFFSRDGELWVKNDVFGKVYRYVGKNSFQYDGLPEGMYEKLHFDLDAAGAVLLTKLTSYGSGKELVNKFERI
ncbi:MAG: hypothetical protein KJO51_01075 [Gramella sp.]|nr:hypothetical protein [Christiangramia sp.]